MSEPKFTPGPWFSVAKLSGSENHRGFKICGDDGWALADIQPVDEDGIEGRANAHLIAAAPDLYKALERIDAFIDDEFMDAAVFSEIIYNALAKARGENND